MSSSWRAVVRGQGNWRRGGHGAARLPAPSSGLALLAQHAEAASSASGRWAESGRPALRRYGVTPQVVAAAPSETALGLLRALQGEAAVVDENSSEGTVLSAAGGLVSVSLPGPVAVGRAVEVGGSLGMVLHYDRHGGAVVGLVSGPPPRSGAPAMLKRPLGVRAVAPPAAGHVAMVHVSELLEEGSSSSVLRWPSLPKLPQRRRVEERLSSGLTAVEALLPPGRGQRIAFAGLPGTGKSRAARLLARSQPPGTAVVVAASGPAARLQSLFAQSTDPSSPGITVVHADYARDTPTAQYLVPLCAMQVAAQLQATHEHVLLLLDDVTAFAQAAADLRWPPMTAPHVLGAILDSAGNAECDGWRQSLSVVAVVDVDREDELSPVLRDVWRNVEMGTDICLPFSSRLASQDIFPAIDVDFLLASGFAPRHQAPLLRQLRVELMHLLGKSRDLQEKLDMGGQLGLHAEPQDLEEAGSSSVSRALLAQTGARSLPEVAVIISAALLYHFPHQRRPPQRSVAAFQDGVVETVKLHHPALWERLCGLESLSPSEVSTTLRNLGQVLLRHRSDFRLTQADA